MCYYDLKKFFRVICLIHLLPAKLPILGAEIAELEMVGAQQVKNSTVKDDRIFKNAYNTERNNLQSSL